MGIFEICITIQVLAAKGSLNIGVARVEAQYLKGSWIGEAMNTWGMN